MHHRDIIDSWLCVTVELCVTSVCYVEGLGHNRFQHSSPLQNTRTVALIRTYHQMFHWHRCELTVEVNSPDEAATHLQNRMLLKYIKNETLLFFLSFAQTATQQTTVTLTGMFFLSIGHTGCMTAVVLLLKTRRSAQCQGLCCRQVLCKCFDSPSTLVQFWSTSECG